jgi:NAD(P)H-dependent FMN reductase
VTSKRGTSILNLEIIFGSTRPGRAADQIIPRINAMSPEHGRFDIDVPDLRDFPLPLFSGTFAAVGGPRPRAFCAPVVKHWNSKIAEDDACLFVTPEYNHSIPAVLKNRIDSVFATLSSPPSPSGASRRVRRLQRRHRGRHPRD